MMDIPWALVVSATINLIVFVIVWFLVRPITRPTSNWWVLVEGTWLGPFKSYRAAGKFRKRYGLVGQSHVNVLSKPGGWKP